MKKLNLKENQKLLIGGVLLFIAMLAIVGYTYSFFQVEDKDTGTITGTVASVSLSIEVNKLAPDITEKGLVPQLDSAIEAAVVGRNSKNCVDDNNNIVCQVYEAVVTNNSSVAIQVDGLLELNAGSNPNLKWAIIDSYSDGMTTKPNLVGEIKTHEETEITTNETYNANQTKRYYIVVWISETTFVQADTGVFTGTITFKDHEENTTTTLTSAEVLENLGLTSLLRTGTPDFKVAATTDEGIYAAEDDLGTSYYFRGASTRNYVKFGKNSNGADMYWRIIRINGDGTVRLIYDGTAAYDNGVSNADRVAGESVFNYEAYSNGGVGYMYGSTLGSTYALEHKNDINSTIKTFLEGEPLSTNTGWYYENIVATGYEEYIADAIYCNDRSLYSGTGVGYDYTEYGAYGRLYKNRTTSVNPVLTCEREEDRFTSEPTVGSVTGNDKLKYPVGLITADEVAMAGGIFETNQNYYLYKGQNYWTMTASYFDGEDWEVHAFDVLSEGDLFGFYNVLEYNGVCPSVSLSSTAIIDGTGEKGDPFVVE